MTNDKIEEAVARAIAGPGYARHGTKHIEEAGRAITAYKSALSDTHVLVPRELLDAAVKRAIFDRESAYVQADPNEFHAHQREAIFELQRQTEPFDDTVGCASAAHEKAQEDSI